MRFVIARRIAILFSCLLVGCSAPVPTVADLADSNIKKLRGAYGMFRVMHQLQAPDSEEELKQYLKTDPGATAKMERLGVDPVAIDEIFISERDGSPFKIRYGVDGMGDDPLIFESLGVDNQRLVAFSVPREVDSAEYEQLWNGKIDRKAGLEAMNRAGGLE